MTEKRKDDRTRNWTVVVYPESAPKNWREILDDLHVPYLVSPLHDKDKNPDGEVKKPHWHVVLLFENKKAFYQIKDIADKLNAPIPQKVESLRGMVRYLVHTDNPEKYQYDRADIENHGVDDLDKYFESASSNRAILNAIIRYIRENNITSFAKLSYYAIDNGKDDWLDCMANRNTMYLNAIITAQYHDNENAEIEKDDRLISDFISFDQEDRQKLENLSKAEKMSRARKMADLGVKQSIIADTLGISERTVRYYLNKKQAKTGENCRFFCTPENPLWL